jgi:hypothetical protein
MVEAAELFHVDFQEYSITSGQLQFGEPFQTMFTEEVSERGFVSVLVEE